MNEWRVRYVRGEEDVGADAAFADVLGEGLGVESAWCLGQYVGLNSE